VEEGKFEEVFRVYSGKGSPEVLEELRDPDSEASHMAGLIESLPHMEVDLHKIRGLEEMAACEDHIEKSQRVKELLGTLIDFSRIDLHWYVRQIEDVFVTPEQIVHMIRERLAGNMGSTSPKD